MGHFYFVRHGQTVWNVENKICGCTDSPLTEYGREQARETGRKILAEGIQADEILCSPLSRAKDTAQLISEMTGIPCRVEPRLIEQNFGKWESTPRDGEDFKKAKEFFACSHEGGESTLRLAQRIYNLLDDIRKESKEKTYILVKNPPWRDSMGGFFISFSYKFLRRHRHHRASRHNCQNLHYHSYYLPESFARHQKARQKYRHLPFGKYFYYSLPRPDS